VRESRTGVRRGDPGPGADALSSAYTQTATGVNALQSTTQERIEEIARIWAETGYTDLFREIHALVLKHQKEPRTVNLGGQWVEIDPRDWKTRKHLTIAVGLGTGNKMERLQHLMAIAQKQELILTTAGPSNPIVTLKNYYNTLAELTEAAGFQSPDPFFTDPGDQQIQAPQQPQIDPAKMLELQQKKDQADQDRMADLQKTQMQLAIQRELGYAKIAVENKAIDVDAALRQRQHEADVALKVHAAQRATAQDARSAFESDRDHATGLHTDMADRAERMAAAQREAAEPANTP
jgi:hypothetical protein